MGWIAVDLDGTLAEYHGWQNGTIGAPVPAMVERVKRWLAEGKDVRIFTARAGILDAVSPESLQRADREFAERQVALIEAWCEQHIGRRLPVTASKDFLLMEIWDDRAVRVRMNTGECIEDYFSRKQDTAVALSESLPSETPPVADGTPLVPDAMNQVRRALRQIAQLPDLTAWIAACEAKQADPLWCEMTSDDLQEQTSHAIDHLRRLESLREAVIAADDRMSSPPKLGPLTRAFLLTWRPRLLDEGIDPED